MGKRSRCTPSLDTSGPWPPFLPAILSISSRKMMPLCSTFSMASLTTRSMSTRFWASSSARVLRASLTLTLRRFLFLGMILPSMSRRLIPISSMPLAEKISTMGMFFSDTSRSTKRSSSLPFLSISRSFCRVPADWSGDATASVVCPSPGAKGFAAGLGSNRSSMRSSAT